MRSASRTDAHGLGDKVRDIPKEHNVSERFQPTGEKVLKNAVLHDTLTGEKGIFKIVNSKEVWGDPGMPFGFGYAWIRTDDGSNYRSRLKAHELASRLLTNLVKLHKKNFHSARPVLAQLLQGHDPNDMFEFFQLYGQLKHKSAGDKRPSDKRLSQFLIGNGVPTIRGRLGKEGEQTDVALPVLVRSWIAHPEDRADETPPDLIFKIQQSLEILRDVVGEETDETRSHNGTSAVRASESME